MAETRKSRVQRKARELQRLQERGLDLSRYTLDEPGRCIECDAVRLILAKQRSTKAN